MLDIFSGLGGFSYAAEELCGGYRTVAFCEIDDYCHKVLRRHWPDVKIFRDVKELTIDSYVNLRYNILTINQKREVDMIIKKKNYDEAVSLYNKGLSIQNVADFYGITRQAMWMILKRRGCKFRSNKKYGKDNHFYRGGISASDKAHNLFEEALERGIIVRKITCDECGCTGIKKNGSSAIEGHHDNYNKPLEIRWLCKKCHYEWHKINKAVEREEVMPQEVSLMNQASSTAVVTGGFP